MPKCMGLGDRKFPDAVKIKWQALKGKKLSIDLGGGVGKKKFSGLCLKKENRWPPVNSEIGCLIQAAKFKISSTFYYCVPIVEENK